MMLFTGIIIGGVVGFLYWKHIDCASGQCILQSNKYMMIIYGAALGAMFFTHYFK